MVLQANNGKAGAERLERMAIMEAALCTSISHPNIVQVRVMESMLLLRLHLL